MSPALVARRLVSEFKSGLTPERLTATGSRGASEEVTNTSELVGGPKVTWPRLTVHDFSGVESLAPRVRVTTKGGLSRPWLARLLDSSPGFSSLRRPSISS